MVRAGYGLVWEEWRRTRKLFVMTVFVLLAIALIIALRIALRIAFGATLTARDGEQIYSFLSRALLVAFIAFLPTSQSSASNIQAGIPTRRYLLPVGTFSLVFWPLAYRLILVAGLASIACVLGNGLFDSKGSELAFGCTAVAATALLHLLAWTARLSGKWLTALGFFLLLFPGFYWTVLYLDAPPLPSPWGELLLPAVAIPVALLVATFAQQVLRTGGLGHLRRANATAATGPVGSDTRGIKWEPFRSAVWAQIWYEWREGGARMVLILCCPACAFLLIPALGSGAAGPWPILVTGWNVLLLLAVPAGLWTFARHETNARRGPARFAHTRPVDDGVLAYAKLGSSAATVLMAFVVVTLFSIAAWTVFAMLDLGMEFPDFVVPELMEQCAIVFLVLGATWIAYTRGGFVVMTGIILGFSKELLGGFLPEVHAYLWEAASSIPLALKLTLLVCSLLLCWPFVRAFRADVLPRRTVPILAGAWASCAVIVSVMLLPMAPLLNEILPYTLKATACWASGAALALLALSPFAPVALRVNRLRHS